MKREVFEAQRAFAGEKKPSMLRRRVGHDYTARQVYMITMVTEGRRPLFGRVTGNSAAPRMELSELGRRVADEWWATSAHHPEIEVLALHIMPDHLHGILFVTTRMERPLGMALRGFKQSCNRHYRTLVLGSPAVVPYVALATQLTEPRDRRGEDRRHGMLFARCYNDRILLREGQLDAWRRYLDDNPRRLLMKREHPDLFAVRRDDVAAGITFSAIGNRFLLDRPYLRQVQCSRRLTTEQIQVVTAEHLAAARAGAVLVSPAISPGEKAVMRAAFDRRLPVIYLQENGFTDLAKPGGSRMQACAEGRLLILAPWSHHNENTAITREQSLMLNEMARRLCER